MRGEQIGGPLPCVNLLEARQAWEAGPVELGTRQRAEQTGQAIYSRCRGSPPREPLGLSHILAPGPEQQQNRGGDARNPALVPISRDQDPESAPLEPDA